MTNGVFMPLINRIGLSSDFFTDPIWQPGFIFGDDINTFISAATINNDLLKIWIILEQHRSDGLLNELSLVEWMWNFTHQWPRLTFLYQIGNNWGFFAPGSTSYVWWRWGGIVTRFYILAGYVNHFWIQLAVWMIPSSNEVFGCHPNTVCAVLMSRLICGTSILRLSR